MKIDPEEPRVLSWESRDPKYPGHEYADYKGHEIKIVPVGAFEYDAIIDGKHVVTGTDDFTATESVAMRFIDNGLKRVIYSTGVIDTAPLDK